MNGESKTLRRVVDGQLCTGCGLCAAVADGAVEMTTAAPGYARPVQTAPVARDQEAKIAAACPGAIVEPWAQAPAMHPSWGPWRSVSVGYATDDSVRFQASSGGGVTALALHALRTGLVDRVVHVLADPEHPTRNLVVCSSDPDQIVSGAGSRYASSSPLAVINKVLEEGGKAAFIGKPCDVSALRRLGRVDPRVAEHVPVMLSFFCAGVPSHDGADRVIKAMGLPPQRVVAFRYRGNGWPGYATARTADGRTAQMSYAESWGGHLSKEVQFRCKICPDGVGGVADVACADAWYGGEAGYPSFDEQDGRSLIVSRTEIGEKLLTSAVAAGDLVLEPLAIDEVDLMQPSQARRKRLVQSRVAALVLTLQPRPRMNGLMVGEARAKATLQEELKSTLGAIRRVILRQR